MISTIHGDMDEALWESGVGGDLYSSWEKRVGYKNDENEFTRWVEYWLNGELVHRSAHVTLKKMPTFATGETAKLGG